MCGGDGSMSAGFYPIDKMFAPFVLDNLWIEENLFSFKKEMMHAIFHT